MKNKKIEHFISAHNQDNNKIYPIIKTFDYFKLLHLDRIVVTLTFNFLKSHDFEKLSKDNSKPIKELNEPLFLKSKKRGLKKYGLFNLNDNNNKIYYPHNKRNDYLTYFRYINKLDKEIKLLSNKYNNISSKQIINYNSFYERIDGIFVSPIFRHRIVLHDMVNLYFSLDDVKTVELSLIRAKPIIIIYVMYLLGIQDVRFLLAFLHPRHDNTNYKIFFNNCNIRNNTVQYHIRYIFVERKLVQKVIKIDILSSLLFFLRKEHNTFH